MRRAEKGDMGEELAVYQEQAVGLLAQKPAEALLQAQEAAAALKAVISTKPKPVIINGEQYLELEDWQTIARFYGMAARVTQTTLVRIENVVGWEASADVVHVATGKIVSSGMGMCLNDEDRWRDRPLFQLRSMAQTRACGKAFRNCLAWVVVLAGYRPTPAEEMTGTETPRVSSAATDEHYCKEHKTEFFKRGKMKSFAHPIAGQEGQWCQEHTAESNSSPQTVEGKAMPVGETVDPRTLKFKNSGEFYSACHNILDMAKSAVDPQISMYDLANPEQREKAWSSLLEQKDFKNLG